MHMHAIVEIWQLYKQKMTLPAHAFMSENESRVGSVAFSILSNLSSARTFASLTLALLAMLAFMLCSAALVVVMRKLPDLKIYHYNFPKTYRAS